MKKKDIHPKLNNVNFSCLNCKQSFNLFSTFSKSKSIHLDVCDKCHPFYIGKQQKFIKKGKVEKFLSKLNKKNK